MIRNLLATALAASLAAFTLSLFGWQSQASAQTTIHLSHTATILSDCQDLMRKLRERYGRAPLCMEVKGLGGRSLTELSGIVGLSDDMQQVWYQMPLTVDAIDRTQYRYNENDLRNVAAMIQYSNRGLTDSEMGRVVIKATCTQFDSRLKAMRETGKLTEKQYLSALADYHKSAADCTR
ncbi:hypothetical protein [Burkholderia sp. BE17]|uniref:hypothetical protein n=1 Tax=Burkholderia sp. BE17 TaxID=2656644 RepID=UPI00128D84E0|nr:hypothetical protein [Burkholderia sp. BE17]MPV65850.1 hypothetical protein [Burkholderia sp. BE17]